MGCGLHLYLKPRGAGVRMAFVLSKDISKTDTLGSPNILPGWPLIRTKQIITKVYF